MKRWPPLYLRILVVIGLALIIAASISDYYGAKTQASYNGSIDTKGAQGVAVFLMSMAGEGDANITVKGVSTAFYITNVSGDIMSLVSSLTVFNISVNASETVHDVRAGLLYGYSTLSTSKYLLTALPGIAKMLDFAIRQAPASNGTVTLRVHLLPSESAVVIGVPDSEIVDYTIEYELTGYHRMSLTGALVLGGALTLAGIVGSVMWSRKTGGE